ncbi:hypothetical protein GCM10027511_10180 [Hymenobacter humi]
MLTPAALLHPDESERLRTLQHYDFMAAPPEDVFTDLVALSAQVFGQPQAFLALVDEDEVHFPVWHGVPAMPPVARAQALCSTAILYPHAVAYQDLATAPQGGADAPAIRAVLSKGAGFYAAAPLTMPDGRPIGVLCLVGPRPRSFDAAEQEVLEAIANVASLAIAVRHLCQSIPELGAEQWETVCRRLRHDVHALRTLLRGLLTEHGTHAPLQPVVLQPVQRRLQALRIVLSE